MAAGETAVGLSGAVQTPVFSGDFDGALPGFPGHAGTAISEAHYQLRRRLCCREIPWHFNHRRMLARRSYHRVLVFGVHRLGDFAEIHHPSDDPRGRERAIRLSAEDFRAAAAFIHEFL